MKNDGMGTREPYNGKGDQEPSENDRSERKPTLIVESSQIDDILGRLKDLQAAIDKNIANQNALQSKLDSNRLAAAQIQKKDNNPGLTNELLIRLEKEIREEERLLDEYTRLEKRYHNLQVRYESLSTTLPGRLILTYWAFLKNRDPSSYLFTKKERKKKSKTVVRKGVRNWVFGEMDERMRARIDKKYDNAIISCDPNTNIRGIQLKSKEILDYFHDLCTRKGLTYMICAGTVLGSVRHGGFIPWDDDIDLAMPREDYEKFLKIINDELRPPYVLRNIYTMPKFVGLYSCLINTNTTVIAYDRRFDEKALQGAFIDIFPIDRVPEDPVERKEQQRNLQKWYRRIEFKRAGFYGTRSRRTSRWDRFLARLLPASLMINRYENESRRYNDGPSRLLAFNGFPEFVNYVYDRDWLFPVKDYSFEGANYPGPNDHESYLKYFYGDYMKMPPEDKRKPHGYYYDAENAPAQAWDFKKGRPK